MTAVTWEFDRDDIRWVGPLTIENDGAVITSGYEVTVNCIGQRPTLWLPPDIEPDGVRLGVLVGAGTSWPATAQPSLYIIRARIVGAVETESAEAGRIRTL